MCFYDYLDYSELFILVLVILATYTLYWHAGIGQITTNHLRCQKRLNIKKEESLLETMPQHRQKVF